MEEDKANKIEGFNQDSPASYRLNTMLPFDVFTEFVAFAKRNTITGLGKIDFGTSIRILLMKAQYADMIYDLDKRISMLENNNHPKETSSVNPTVKTFGITKHKEVI